MRKNITGFTLLELIVVVLIVATLSALAIPRYIRAREYAIGKEAQANMRLIAAAEKMYYLEYGDYWPSPLTDVTDIGTINFTLNLALNETYWDYHVGSGGGYAYIAWADRKGLVYPQPFWSCQWLISNLVADTTGPYTAFTCP